MTLNKKDLINLRNKYGEAFYLLDSSRFRANFVELENAFSGIYPDFKLAYSYKTNYIPKLCKAADELGGYAEVVSETEVALALRCGVKPEKIIWNGPVKNPEKLEIYMLIGVTVNIDSLEEAVCIRNIANKNRKVLNVGVRCNFDIGDGVISRFGLDVGGKDFSEVMELVLNSEKLHFVGFQCHFAKRQIGYWAARAQKMTELIERTGIVPERIDLGGGLYGKMPDSMKAQFEGGVPSFAEYASTVASVFADFFKGEKKKPELVIEPGTALAGDCMSFAVTVKNIKNVRDRYVATVLGSQQNINMAGINPPVRIVRMGNPGKRYEKIDIAGFTCIEGDLLYRGYKGTMAVNDMLIFENCGSYSFVLKPPFILPNFPIIDIGGKGAEMVKHAEIFDDFFHGFC